MKKLCSDISREHFSFLGSMFVVLVASQATMVVDAAIGGNLLGNYVISVVNLVTPIDELFYALSLLLGAGAGTIASVMRGKGETLQVRRHFTVAILSYVVVAICFGCALYISGNQITILLCGESSLVSHTHTYLVSLIPFFIFSGVLYILKVFTAIEGKPQLVMYCSLAQFAVNVLFNVTLIKFAGLGIEALAYSSILSTLVGITLLIPNYLKSDCIFRAVKCSKCQFFQTLRTNVSYGGGFLSVDVAYIIMYFSMNYLVLHYMGERGLFCWSVVMMIMLTCNYAVNASVETSLLLGGKYIGAKNFSAARLINRRSVLFAVAFISILFLLIFTIPDKALTVIGASDIEAYPQLVPFIALVVPFVLGTNILNVFLARLISNGAVILFSVLESVMYLCTPLMFFMFHIVASGYEKYSFLALIPIYVVIFIVTRFKYAKQVDNT